MAKKAKEVKPFQCPCGKLTCGVGKDKGQLRRDFLLWAGDTPETRVVDRKVRNMVPDFYGNRGR